MPFFPYKHIDRIMRLWRAGYTMQQIGDKLKVSKQCIAARVKLYLKCKRPLELYIWKKIYECKICGTEREEIYKFIPIYKMNIMKLGETVIFVKQHHWVCDDCLRENLVKCRICLSIGRPGIDFLPSRCQNKWFGVCRQCNRELASFHYYKRKLK